MQQTAIRAESKMEQLIADFYKTPNLDTIYYYMAIKYQLRYIFIIWEIRDNIYLLPSYLAIDRVHKSDLYSRRAEMIDHITAITNKITKVSKLYKMNTSINMIIDKEINMTSMDVFILQSLISQIIYECKEKKLSQWKDFILDKIITNVKAPLNKMLNIVSIVGVDAQKLKHLNETTFELSNNILNVIDLLQLETNKFILNEEVTNVRDLLISVPCNITIENSVPHLIHADGKRIKQIINNYINFSTSRQSTEINLVVSSTLLSVEEKMPNDKSIYHEIKFTFSDDSKPIDDDVHLLMRQFDDKIKNKDICLQINYLIVKKMKGDIIFSTSHSTSHQVQHSTSHQVQPKYTFQFITYECVDVGSIKTLKGRRVLLIDSYTIDDRINLCKFMDASGIIYTLANSAEEVNLLHGCKRFDIIIIKLIDDGRSIYKKINSTYPNTPIICLIKKNKNIYKQYNDYINIDNAETEIKYKLLNAINRSRKLL